MDRTHTRPPSGFSRRDFLRGSGAVAAAGAIVTQTQAIAQEAKGTRIIAGEQTLTLNVKAQFRDSTGKLLGFAPRTAAETVIECGKSLLG